MFVVASRSKQYLTFVYNRDKECEFLKRLDVHQDTLDDIPEYEVGSEDETIEKPIVRNVRSTKRIIGVHEIRKQIDDGGGPGLGKEYGTMIHELAELLQKNPDADVSGYPEREVKRIKRFLDSKKGYNIRSELDLYCPVDGTDMTLHGIADVMIHCGDHVEVHDYKTDLTIGPEREYEYKVQVSVYAHTLARFYNLPVKCYLQYLSRDEEDGDPVLEFDPVDFDIIRDRVKEML